MKYWLLIIILLTTNLYANMASKVAAIVGDDIISVHDLKKRLQLMVNLQSQPITVLQLRNLVPVALDELIEEKIAFKEANRLKLALTEAEIKAAINAIKQQDHLTDEQLNEALRVRHISMENLQEQIKGQLIKEKIILENVAPSINVTPKEIEDKFIQTQPQRVQIAFKTIFIPYTAKDFDEKKRQLTKLREKITNCDSAEQLVKTYANVKLEHHQMSFANLPGLLKNELQNYAVNQPTRLMKSPSIIQLGIICRKDYIDFSEQEKQAYYSNLRHEKMLVQANIHFSKLRKQAHIEVRDENLQDLEFAHGTINVVH